jgi:DnaJ-class molecular chaperone
VPGFTDRPFHAHQSDRNERTQRTAGSPGAPPRGAAPPAEETFYQLLGVQYGAKPADITRAYREAMKRNHPDRAHPERRAASEELAKRLNHAYAVLSKPASRKAYDESIRAQGIQEQIMGRYVAGPGLGGAHDPFAQDLRREKSAFESREQVQAGRSATVTMFAAFASVAAVIIAAILLFSVLALVVERVF